MTCLVDYLLAVSAAVITATAMILATLLWRYRELVKEADASTRLAKDVWDSMNSRFSVVDARIIDLMAKTEVLSSKSVTSQVASQQEAISWPKENVTHMPARPRESSVVTQSQTASWEGTETETKVLRLLAQGPRTSAQIKEEVGRSREHTARLMKALFERGLVVRNDRNKPYVYEITESGKLYVAS